MTGWTSPADVRARAQRRWDDGSVLCAYAAGETAPMLDLRVRGPVPREIGGQLAQVRAWRDDLVAGSRAGAAFSVVERSVGGRVIGAMALPDRVQVTTYDQWWRLLGVTSQVRALDGALARCRHSHPALVPWIQRRPLTAIELADGWTPLLAAYDWLADEAGGGRYLREIEAPGVDTKFVQSHTRVLGEWLDLVVVPDTRYAASRRFAARYGFAEAPNLIRMRADPALTGLIPEVREVGLRVEDLASLAVRPSGVLIIENQATYLSAPTPHRGLVIWGHGFDAARLGRISWLRETPKVRYWGDLDTHGFAILGVLRSQLPQVTSVLMDRETLLHHRDRWVTEPTPTRADLQHLTAPERALYEDLAEDAFGPAVRLEQERIPWPWALRHL